MPSRLELLAQADYAVVIAMPFGPVGVRTQDERITAVAYLPPEVPTRSPVNALAREACAQFRAYLRNPKHRIDLPYVVEGSDFERKVWSAIATIGSGDTRTYGELATALATAARPVGRACGSNPVPLIVPCHRVVAAGGGLGGFMHSRAAASVAIKDWLLRHEGRR